MSPINESDGSAPLADKPVTRSQVNHNVGQDIRNFRYVKSRMGLANHRAPFVFCIPILWILVSLFSSLPYYDLILGAKSAAQQRKTETVQVYPAKQTESCHLRELELCIIGATSIVQNPNGIPVTEVEIKRQCELLQESNDCFEEYGKNCLTENQSALARMFLRDMFALKRDFCTAGSDLRNNYKRHSTCLREVQKKYQRVCIADLQVGFESIHKLNYSLVFQTTCCNLNRMMNCFLPRVEDDCGPETLNLMKKLIERTFGSAQSIICRKFDPFSDTCEALLPKIGTKPHVGRNTSAISRILSSYVNVG